MIKNIIFDFGDVFINLDKEIVFREMKKYGSGELTPELLWLNNTYEVGQIETNEFISGLQSSFPSVDPQKIAHIWNSMILDFPDYRLDFIESFAKEKSHRFYLLSNTNSLHISQVEKNMGMERYTRFKSCFEQFYLSHEIHLRKPNADIFEFVLEENKLDPSETFFVDDTQEHTETAKKLGIKTWNLIVGQEDVIEIKSKL